jgi:hypothetical protein
MGLTATGSNKEFKPVPEGNHTARCYRVIDLGTQDVEFQGEPKLMHKVLIGWELDGEAEDGTPLKTDDGRPLTVSKQYTLSLSKKANLRADLESWRGKAFSDDELKGFNIGQLLGVYCMVTVKHDVKGEKTYTNVASVARWPAALKNAKFSPVHINEMFDVDAPDMQMFDTFPDWLKDKIKACLEWASPAAVEKPKAAEQKRTATAQSGDASQPPTEWDELDSEIPF